MARTPKLCRHRRSNRAYSTDPVSEKECYHGPWGDNPDRCTVAETLAAYHAWCQRLFTRRGETGGVDLNPDGLTVGELMVAHARWAKAYYVKRGKPTSEAGTIGQTHRFIEAVHADTLVTEFGPSALKAVRAAMLAHVSERTGRRYPRGHVNDQVERVRGIFRWGVENELVPAAILHGLEAVRALAKGRTDAPEETPILPVPFEVVEATLPRLRPLLRALVRFHLATACRADEAVRLRPCDLDRSATPWRYVPAGHKTEHHERGRVIPVGPKAREAVAELLERTPPDGWLFPSCGRGVNLGRGDGHLSVSGYRQAIADACCALEYRPARQGRKERLAREAIPLWTPLELRHAGLSLIRKRFGLEAAQKVAGHASAKMTEHYAAADWQQAAAAAEQAG